MPRGSRAVLILTLSVTLGRSPRARAESEPHVHDGFALRFAAGTGWLDFGRETDHQGAVSTVAYSGDASSVMGVPLVLDVSIGGTPFSRVVIGGLLHTEVISAARLETAGGVHHDLAGPLLVGLLAPTVDVLSDPRGGLHYGLGVGVAAASARLQDPLFRTIGGIGPGFTIDVGYDFWTSPEWSTGLMARGVFASLGREQESGGVRGHERDTVASATVLATIVYQ